MTVMMMAVTAGPPQPRLQSVGYDLGTAVRALRLEIHLILTSTLGDRCRHHPLADEGTDPQRGQQLAQRGSQERTPAGLGIQAVGGRVCTLGHPAILPPKTGAVLCCAGPRASHVL